MPLQRVPQDTCLPRVTTSSPLVPMAYEPTKVSKGRQGRVSASSADVDFTTQLLLKHKVTLANGHRQVAKPLG